MRLIDLHCNWAIQYACESTQYDPALYRETRERLTQVDGYLSAVAAAIVVCGRRAADWAAQADPWRTLGEMIARYEAEFSGRMLHGPDDAARWLAEPDDGICWGMLGVEGFDFLIRESCDLRRLPDLFARGVRIFQLVATASSQLAGAGIPEDERGLTELGYGVLDGLAELAPPPDELRPRPAVDLAGLNSRSTGDVLSWFEADPARCQRLRLLRSYGGVERSSLSVENMMRLRALGGVIGLSVGHPYVETPEELRGNLDSTMAAATVGQKEYEGIAVGTAFLDLEQCLTDLTTASQVAQWLKAAFPAEIAAAICRSNARRLLLEITGFPSR